MAMAVMSVTMESMFSLSACSLLPLSPSALRIFFFSYRFFSFKFFLNSFNIFRCLSRKLWLRFLEDFSYIFGHIDFDILFRLENSLHNIQIIITHDGYDVTLFISEGHMGWVKLELFDYELNQALIVESIAIEFNLFLVDEYNLHLKFIWAIYYCDNIYESILLDSDATFAFN